MAKAPEVEKKKLPTHFRSDMPQAFAAAGRIIQILTVLSLDDAEKALGMVNQMFGVRKELADKPAFVEDGK